MAGPDTLGPHRAEPSIRPRCILTYALREVQYLYKVKRPFLRCAPRTGELMAQSATEVEMTSVAGLELGAWKGRVDIERRQRKVVEI